MLFISFAFLLLLLLFARLCVSGPLSLYSNIGERERERGLLGWSLVGPGRGVLLDTCNGAMADERESSSVQDIFVSTAAVMVEDTRSRGGEERRAQGRVLALALFPCNSAQCAPLLDPKTTHLGVRLSLLLRLARSPGRERERKKRKQKKHAHLHAKAHIHTLSRPSR